MVCRLTAASSLAAAAARRRGCRERELSRGQIRLLGCAVLTTPPPSILLCCDPCIITSHPPPHTRPLRRRVVSASPSTVGFACSLSAERVDRSVVSLCLLRCIATCVRQLRRNARQRRPLPWRWTNPPRRPLTLQRRRMKPSTPPTLVTCTRTRTHHITRRTREKGGDEGEVEWLLQLVMMLILRCAVLC